MINFTKNESHIIDGLNHNQTYDEEKRTYMQRALDLVLICQRLKSPNFDFNVMTSFNIDNFKLKSSSIEMYKIMWRDSYDGNTSDLYTKEKHQQIL